MGPTKQSSAPKPAEARRKMVYQVVERFLDQGAVSDADLLHSVTSMSGDEFRQVCTSAQSQAACLPSLVNVWQTCFTMKTFASLA